MTDYQKCETNQEGNSFSAETPSEPEFIQIACELLEQGRKYYETSSFEQAKKRFIEAIHKLMEHEEDFFVNPMKQDLTIHEISNYVHKKCQECTKCCNKRSHHRSKSVTPRKFPSPENSNKEHSEIPLFSIGDSLDSQDSQDCHKKGLYTTNPESFHVVYEVPVQQNHVCPYRLLHRVCTILCDLLPGLSSCLVLLGNIQESQIISDISKYLQKALYGEKCMSYAVSLKDLSGVFENCPLQQQKTTEKEVKSFCELARKYEVSEHHHNEIPCEENDNYECTCNLSDCSGKYSETQSETDNSELKILRDDLDLIFDTMQMSSI